MVKRSRGRTSRNLRRTNLRSNRKNRGDRLSNNNKRSNKRSNRSNRLRKNNRRNKKSRVNRKTNKRYKSGGSLERKGLQYVIEKSKGLNLLEADEKRKLTELEDYFHEIDELILEGEIDGKDFMGEASQEIEEQKRSDPLWEEKNSEGKMEDAWNMQYLVDLRLKLISKISPRSAARHRSAAVEDAEDAAVQKAIANSLLEEKGHQQPSGKEKSEDPALEEAIALTQKNETHPLEGKIEEISKLIQSMGMETDQDKLKNAINKIGRFADNSLILSKYFEL